MFKTSFNYAFNYVDHLGNVRLTYSDDGNGNDGIEEETNYYAFGLKHEGYNDGTYSINNYKYNGKELQEELGLNFYDYGARNFDTALGRWFSIDPKSETSRRFSPYAYAMDNPVYFIDPDGMEALEYANRNDEVIIRGEDAKKAANALDKSSSLNITRDNKTGKLSATGEAKTDYDKALLEAITSPDIKVDLQVISSETFSVGGVTADIVVDAYAGSVRTSDGKTEASEFINMNHIQKVEDGGATKAGNSVGHAVNEAFIGAKENGGINRAFSENGDAAYKAGHEGAVAVDKANFKEHEFYNNVLGTKYIGYPGVEKPIKLN